MKKIALLTLLLINLSLSFSLPRNQASPAIFSVTQSAGTILFRHTDSTQTIIPCQSVASIVSNADPSKIVSVWVVQQGDYDKIMQFDYSVCGFSSKSDAVDSLTAWAICDTSSGGGGGSQTLSISNDSLTISGGNTVVLPVYVQADSSTISSYEVLNSQNAPPGSPSTGDVYLVGTSPSGAWVGHAKDIAEWNGSSWVFTDGVQGDFLYNATTALTYIFRSGNWVQTTGIPALNNGNTISSGLIIGTNNSRSLTFETNNVNRGRFDSVGRFYVYNLPISTDTFVNVVDENGKFGKVGKSSIVDTSVISTKANVTGLLLGYVTPTSTTTFTNKRITARVDSTTSSATPTINTDNIDTYKLTAQAVDITSFTTNLTGTPTDDQILHIIIKGTGARTISWGSSFEASTVALPTTTVSTDRLDVYFIWNTATSKWRCGGVW